MSDDQKWKGEGYVVGGRIPADTALSWQYFQAYRDQTQRPRSIRDLSKLVVNGKKRIWQQMGRWSAKDYWPERVAEWDAAQTLDATTEAAKTHQQDIQRYIKADIDIAEICQRITKKALKEIEETGTTEVDGTKFRTIMLGYGASRENMLEVLGVYRKLQELEGVQ